MKTSWLQEKHPFSLFPPACLRTFVGHTDGSKAWRLHDGKRAISASWDRTLRLWDLESGKQIRRFNGHTQRSKMWWSHPMETCHLRVPTIGPYAYGTWRPGSNYTYLKDIQIGSIVSGHTRWQTSHLRFADTDPRLWDLDSKEQVYTFEGHIDRVNCGRSHPMANKPSRF